MPKPPLNIDAYLKGAGEPQVTALQKLRRQILQLVPTAEECISYSMPAFRWRGQVVAGFLATRKGCSFFPFSGRTLDTLAADVANYGRTKSALHFDPARGLPKSLLRKLLTTRQAEIAAYPSKARTAGRATQKASPTRVKKPVPVTKRGVRTAR